MFENKEAPSSRDAEESVLGSILRDGVSIYEKVSAWIRDEEAFYYTDNRIIWKAIKKVYKAGENIDVVGVANIVKDDNPNEKLGYFITGLITNIATTANVEYHAKIIWERHIQREAAKTANKLDKAAADHGVEASDEAVDIIEDGLGIRQAKTID